MENKRVIFVSEMRNPEKDASSTQIMTRNLLYGFHEVCEELIFIPIISNDSDKEPVRQYYGDLCTKMVFFHDCTKWRGSSLFGKISMLFSISFLNRIDISPIKQFLRDGVIIVSHSPSIDSAIIGKAIKLKYPDITYIQYWGDPLALSLITPNQLKTLKYRLFRAPQILVERKLHKYADKIVYGTKSLGVSQLEFYREIKKKTACVEVPYTFDNKDNKRGKEPLLFGYFGNYYSNVRNIMPLYKAFETMPEAELVICGFSDIELSCKKNIAIKKRVPQSVVPAYEAELDVVICILNRVGIQIPGKIFYQTNTQKHILVILDGPNKESIFEELSPSERFIFCDNTKDSIQTAVSKICALKRDNLYSSDCYSPKNVCEQILR